MNSKAISKQKSKSSINNNKGKKIRKKSPKTIDYNKVAEKYGNLLETSLNTSDNTQTNNANKINEEKANNDSYYDYIIDNIYNDKIKDNNKVNKKENDKDNKKVNNILKENKNNNINNNDNDDSIYYFTFKQKMNEFGFNKNKNNSITNNNILKKHEPIYICNKKEELNIKNMNNKMYNTFSTKFKKNKSINSNISYKNDFADIKRIDKVKNNFKSNKSYNNIKTNLSRDRDNKKEPKTCIDNIHNLDNIDTYNKNYTNIINSNKHSDINNNKNKKEEINPKFKEKVTLLLNLCRKYANKFNKLFPLCESSLMSESNNNNILNHNSLKELKNTIIQYNNMIFNDNISKIFDLDDNNKFISYNLKEINEYEKKYEELKLINQKLIKKNEKLNLEIKELSIEIKNFTKIEHENKEQINLINKLKNKIELLNNEIKNKDNIIKNLENQINKNNISIKDFNGLNDDLNKNILFNKLNNLNEIRKDSINNANTNIMNDDKKIKKEEKKQFYNDINSNLIEIENTKDISNNNIQKENNIINNNKINKINLIIENEKNERMNSEIEQLDQEILNLKSKLKKIIQK